jgi:Fur family transcriptional regulator, zinc uptake regulator
MNVASKLQNSVFHTNAEKSLTETYEENAISALKAAGFRITMPRIQVIRALATTKVALSAYDVHERIISTGGRIDVVSVYRVLGILQEVGLIHKVGVANGYFPNLEEPDVAKHSLIVLESSNSKVHPLDLPTSLKDSIISFTKESGFDADILKIEVVGASVK